MKLFKNVLIRTIFFVPLLTNHPQEEFWILKFDSFVLGKLQLLDHIGMLRHFKG